MVKRVGKFKRVSIQYSLATGKGVQIRTAGSKAIQYVHGCGGLFPKLEAALEGRRVGDVVQARLLPDDAFGRRNTDLLHEVPLKAIPEGEDINIGNVLVGQDEQGNAVSFRILSVDNGILKLDANHPLAGETLIFEVEIQGIEEPSPAEIADAQKSALQLRPE